MGGLTTPIRKGSCWSKVPLSIIMQNDDVAPTREFLVLDGILLFFPKGVRGVVGP